MLAISNADACRPGTGEQARQVTEQGTGAGSRVGERQLT